MSISLVAASCASNDESTSADTSASGASASAAPVSEPAATEPATTEPATTEPAATAKAPDTSSPDTEPSETSVDLAELVLPIIEASMEPSAIPWDCCGVNIPPTSVRVGVRLDGYDDVVLASGVRLDGTPAETTDPFDVASLGQTMISQAARSLIQNGTIDPTATVAQWLPGQPNADRVTVRMLIDNTHGWTTAYDDTRTTAILEDLGRPWTITEALGLAATLPPVAEPGTFDPTGEGNAIGLLALASVLEQTTGSSIADVVRAEVFGPLGLDDTLIGNGTDEPADMQYGKFVLPGGTEALDPRDLSTVAFRSISPDGNAMISTVPDLLDLSSAWATGDYPGGTAPTPDDFVAEYFRTDDNGTPVAVSSLELPFSGYCPCVADGDSVAPVRMGRQPNAIGSTTFVLIYPADGVQVVLHYNSQEWIDRQDLVDVVDEIHDAVVEATMT